MITGAIFALVLLSFSFLVGYSVGREDADGMRADDLTKRFDLIQELQQENEELRKKLNEISNLEA